MQSWCSHLTTLSNTKWSSMATMLAPGLYANPSSERKLSEFCRGNQSSRSKAHRLRCLRTGPLRAGIQVYCKQIDRTRTLPCECTSRHAFTKMLYTSSAVYFQKRACNKASFITCKINSCIGYIRRLCRSTHRYTFAELC